MSYRDPTPEDLEDPAFNTIWNAIKKWDINVPEQYVGYCGATGNHVMVILDDLRRDAAKWDKRLTLWQRLVAAWRRSPWR